MSFFHQVQDQLNFIMRELGSVKETVSALSIRLEVVEASLQTNKADAASTTDESAPLAVVDVIEVVEEATVSEAEAFEPTTPKIEANEATDSATTVTTPVVAKGRKARNNR